MLTIKKPEPATEREGRPVPPANDRKPASAKIRKPATTIANASMTQTRFLARRVDDRVLVE